MTFQKGFAPYLFEPIGGKNTAVLRVNIDFMSREHKKLTFYPKAKAKAEANQKESKSRKTNQTNNTVAFEVISQNSPFA